MDTPDATVKAFFQTFADDFAAFDGVLIASRYYVPFEAINAEGKITIFSSSEAIAAYFQRYLDQYSKEGARSCHFELISYCPTGRKTALAIIKWQLRNQEGLTTAEWRESYHLLETDDGLWVLTSSDF